MTPRGTVKVPGDKSISHRSLMLGALSDGVSTVRGMLRSADVASTAQVLTEMGVRIENRDGLVTIHGRGIRGLQPPTQPLDCGNSGTTCRLVAGIVAAHPFAAEFVGDPSLSKRPMRRVAEPLQLMGARFEFGEGDGLPMRIHGGSLRSIGFATRSASAQVKSAILLAALVSQIPVSVTEPRQSRDHSERMLAARGASILVDGTTVSLGVVQGLPATDITVPGDPSAAAFFVALAAMVEGAAIDLPDVCLNGTRTGFFNVVQRMGAIVRFADQRVADGETVGCVEATGTGTLIPVTVGADEVPSMIDEIPMLACLAARARGETVISGASELRVKESDRIRAVVQNLQTVGVDAEELPDGMVVRGSDAPLAGRVDPHDDHRLAMAFGILGALPGNAIEITDRDCVAVSYPDFWTDLARIVA